MNYDFQFEFRILNCDFIDVLSLCIRFVVNIQ
jgi:hypothetical protein